MRALRRKERSTTTEGTGWTIENCEVRWNSGAGIGIGTGGRVRDCDIHHNGQIGIEGHGETSRSRITASGRTISTASIYTWEAGGVKIALESDGVTFRGNHVHDNDRSRVVVRYRLPQRRL